MSATRADVVAEARTWLGTPYHHMGDVKGAGVDCAMILVRVFCDLLIVPFFDPRPYPAQWHLHRDEPRYLNWIKQNARKVEHPGPGDVPLFTFGRHAAHGAIIVDDDYMIHAYGPAQRVELIERRAFAHRLDSYWSPFPEGL